MTGGKALVTLHTGPRLGHSAPTRARGNSARRDVRDKPMDRENDHRDGWNVMGALTFCGQDEKGSFRVGVFGYTRKCVGDYLDWEAAQ